MRCALWINNNWARTGAYWIVFIRTSFYWVLLVHTSSRSVQSGSRRMGIDPTPPYCIALPPIESLSVTRQATRTGANPQWTKSNDQRWDTTQQDLSLFYPKFSDPVRMAKGDHYCPNFWTISTENCGDRTTVYVRMYAYYQRTINGWNKWIGYLPYECIDN